MNPSEDQSGTTPELHQEVEQSSPNQQPQPALHEANLLSSVIPVERNPIFSYGSSDAINS
jgi:hypothetical protein